MNILPIETDLFTYEHFFHSQKNLEDIKNFSVGKNAEGLESFIKSQAEENERLNADRTYLVRDKITGELAAYFTLRAGTIVLQSGAESFSTLPGIELSNFAVNQSYKTIHSDMNRIGASVFLNFIIPIAKYVSDFIGVNSLYIFALPYEKLIDYYQSLGFSRFPDSYETFLHSHIKPEYDEKCIFMFRQL